MTPTDYLWIAGLFAAFGMGFFLSSLLSTLHWSERVDYWRSVALYKPTEEDLDDERKALQREMEDGYA